MQPCWLGIESADAGPSAPLKYASLRMTAHFSIWASEDGALANRGDGLLLPSFILIASREHPKERHGTFSD
jgi:hypothetical protein